MSAKVSCTVLRGGKRGDPRTSPDRNLPNESVAQSGEVSTSQRILLKRRRYVDGLEIGWLHWIACLVPTLLSLAR